MLVLDDVHTYYGKSHILHGVSIEVRAGEVVGLLGRNGVGKSTTLKTVMGLVRPSEGHVTFEGREIGGLASHHVAHLGIAWVPEDRRIFKLLSVMETHATVELVRRIAANLTILIVEHDMEVVMGLAHRITVLHYGQVLAEGSPAEIQANPRVQEVYLKT